MKFNQYFLLLYLVLLVSCSNYRLTNSSTYPISLNIAYEFKDSLNRIPVQLKKFNKESKNKKITNYKESITGLGGTISFDIPNKKYTNVTFLIFGAHNVSTIKPNSNLIIQVINSSSKVDTVYQIQNGEYQVNKFKKMVSPNIFYKRFRYFYHDNLK